jgi:hypothetical protein
MKLKIKKLPQSVGSAFQPKARHYWPGPATQRPSRPMPAGAACARCGLRAVATRGFLDGLGVACPAGTPQGSDSGCAEQGGAAGFSTETADGGGAEKAARHGGVPRRQRSFGCRGGRR